MNKNPCTYWKNKGYTIVIHPECPNEVVQATDVIEINRAIWDTVMHDKSKSKHYAIATESFSNKS